MRADALAFRAALLGAIRASLSAAGNEQRPELIHEQPLAPARFGWTSIRASLQRARRQAFIEGRAGSSALNRQVG